VRHGLHRLGLADHALADDLLHLQQLLALALPASARPECRSSATHAGDVLGRHFLAQHRIGLAVVGLGKLALELGIRPY
jgi:hypothetical protein